MRNEFIGQCIAATSRDLRRWSITLLVVAALIGLCGARELVNAKRGPAQLEERRLSAISGPEFALHDDLVLGSMLGGVFLLLGLWSAIKSKRHSEHPETHPLCKALSQYGTLYTLVPAIDEEARTASTLTGVTFTLNWVMSCSLTKTVVMHRQEIVWIYKKRTKHFLNIIPTGTSYSLVLCDSRGKLLEISNSEANIDIYLSGFVEQTPWVIFGFNRTTERLYKKVRPFFVKAVSGRKLSMEAKSA
jgi:hypothetical protein